ncbi:MAG: YceI family protein [Gemmatimonadaceae bacterium]
MSTDHLLRIATAVMALHVASAGAQAVHRCAGSAHTIDGVLAFDARATVGQFRGETRAVRGAASCADSLGSTMGYVETDVRSIKTGNGMRDRDMYASLNASTYPVIRFDLINISPGATLASGGIGAILHGQLHVNGVTRTIDAPATIYEQADSTRLQAAFPVSLGSFRLTGLSKLFGVLKVDDGITVSIDLTFATDSTRT